jgi:hypothetical protein
MKKYYQTLGLEDGASKQEIQDAYDKLSVELDPKNNDNLDFFKEEFALLQEAYEKLMGHVPESIDNESSEKKVEDTEQESDTNSSKMALGDGETLISLFKKYLDLGVKEKKEMVEVLEELQSHDKKYLDALQLIYKTEGVESFKEFIAKQSNKKKETSPKQQGPSKPSGVKKPAKNTDKPPKNSDKNKKIIIRSIVAVFFLVFGITYLIFQNKVEKVKAGIPIIEKKELERNEQNKTYWTNKYNTDYPNKDFTYLNLDSRTIRDTLVSFFIYKKYLPINTFKECFFECVYYSRINIENYSNFFVSSFSKGKRPKNLSKYFYLKLEKDITRKYKITKDEFEKLVDLAINTQYSWGNEAFIKENKTSKDIECLSCYNDYRANYIINDLAVDEFKDFVKKYIKEKKAIDASNRIVEREYNSKYNNLTSGMSYSLKNKVKSRVNSKSLVTSIKEYYNFNFFHGIGNVDYSFDKKKYNTSSLEDIVNDVYKEYYSDNSLYTGATPYSYCYGGNPYCSPPSGYAECSFIDVRASSNSDVIVIIKKNNRVYSHAYIKAGGYYKFKLGNGNFQSFFYYGKGWNPNKYIKNANCGKIIGGFVNNESLDKSEVEYLYNSSMSYTLYSVENGNFRPKSSNKNEAF